MRLPAGLAAVALAALAGAAPAPATETIGQTGPPLDCGIGRPLVQRVVSSGPSYSPSADGVITSWSTQVGSTAGRTLKLLVLRPDPGTGPNNFVVTQKDELRTETVPNQLNTFSGMSLRIRADERLGLYNPTPQPGAGSYCAFNGTPTDKMAFTSGPLAEPEIGASVNFALDDPVRLNVSAVVEPDADGDGSGDETQDQCLGLAGEVTGCPQLETTITKGPKDKTKRKQATFEFSANLDGATFACSLDGAAFAPCSSPDTLKVKKGKHTLAVRATAKGQTDATPATDDWKVKKKK